MATECEPPPALAQLSVPIVCGVESDLFLADDPATVDGDRGLVILEQVEAVPVVTSFLERPDGRVLLLRRSSKVGSYPGAWAAVSGYLEGDDMERWARREIYEEVGYAESASRLELAGPPIRVRQATRIFIVHPFRFRVEPFEVRLDWEHTEFEWVEPAQIVHRETVPKLDRAWAAVAGPAPGPRLSSLKKL